MICVITKGTYSDYHICAVATNRERAEELKRMYSDRYNDAEIEEFEENVPSNEFYTLNPCTYWEINFNSDGTSYGPSIYFDKPNLNIQVQKSWNNSIMVINITADSAETAFKIARDERAKYLAQQFGL